MSTVSANYRELLPSEVEAVAKECAEAWKDPSIPLKQYELCVKGELERWRNGESIAPFEALVRCWPHMNWAPSYHPTLLDVGASSGYYREVLKARDIPVDYNGCDFSPEFVWLALQLHPDLVLRTPDVPVDYSGCDYWFIRADARALPYEADHFDVVLSSAVIMHILDYEKAIAEAARVARRFVIFNRTPITMGAEPKFYEKEAYGVKTLEIHFNLTGLLQLFAANNLALRHSEPIFWDADQGYGHTCFLLENVSLAHYPA